MTAAEVHPRQVGTEFAAHSPITRCDLLRAAIEYAKCGRPVFPCCPWDGAALNYKREPIDAKAPLTDNTWRNGKDDATCDLDQIVKAWAKSPWAMIGSPVAVDETCIDVDSRTDGRHLVAHRAGRTAGSTAYAHSYQRALRRRSASVLQAAGW
jgi:hypothetical protein